MISRYATIIEELEAYRAFGPGEMLERQGVCGGPVPTYVRDLLRRELIGANRREFDVRDTVSTGDDDGRDGKHAAAT